MFSQRRLGGPGCIESAMINSKTPNFSDSAFYRDKDPYPNPATNLQQNSLKTAFRQPPMRSNNLHWPPMQPMIIKRVKAGLTQLIDGIEISKKEMERDTGIEPV